MILLENKLESKIKQRLFAIFLKSFKKYYNLVKSYKLQEEERILHNGNEKLKRDFNETTQVPFNPDNQTSTTRLIQKVSQNRGNHEWTIDKEAELIGGAFGQLFGVIEFGITSEAYLIGKTREECMAEVEKMDLWSKELAQALKEINYRVNNKFLVKRIKSTVKKKTKLREDQELAITRIAARLKTEG